MISAIFDTYSTPTSTEELLARDKYVWFRQRIDSKCAARGDNESWEFANVQNNVGPNVPIREYVRSYTHHANMLSSIH